ncbi:unnamed protein product, partial [Mesorhabditis belari]|uniref:W2 domain-containing protein n=1 Tax=Mesorhabditis belari TaxID=2138241 RepID=A0AAF3EMB6_9BILA
MNKLLPKSKSRSTRNVSCNLRPMMRRLSDVLLVRAPHIIKGLYDTDICDEDSILKWAESQLQNDDDDDDDDDEIKFDGAKTSQMAQQNAERLNKQITAVNDENGEEIDIENI